VEQVPLARARVEHVEFVAKANCPVAEGDGDTVKGLDLSRRSSGPDMTN
jgi:hypothetical protein